MKLKKQFYKDVAEMRGGNVLPCAGEPFKEEDFAHLPKALRMYIRNSGYIGKPKMSCLKMEYKDVDFAQGTECRRMASIFQRSSGLSGIIRTGISCILTGRLTR